MPSTRTPALLASLAALLAVAVAPAAGQSWVSSELRPELALPVEFGLTLLVNLVVGAIVLGVAPDFTRRTAARIRENPGGTTLMGIVVGIAAIVVTVLLALTIVGLLVVIPGLVVLALVQLAATAAAVVALGLALLSRRGSVSHGRALVVGSVVLALVGLVPLLGPLVTWLVTSAGLGAVANGYLDSRGGDSPPGCGRSGASAP
jgi:hypothetical protein